MIWLLLTTPSGVAGRASSGETPPSTTADEEMSWKML